MEGGYLYVEKTDLLFDLILGKQRFLSRPRRFGKSLFLTTLAAIFRGQADLFAGLKIANLGYEFKKYPVLHLDMSLGSSSQDNLLKSLRGTLEMIGKAEGKKEFDSDIPGLMLKELVEALIAKYHENVVMLIDEYDYPVSHYIG
ncbi:MAG: AAA family ATPase, partial [Deltaproteobacteria bacterium]|nr:AAA family ATPase [Deltaproteobacteria bacterium]